MRNIIATGTALAGALAIGVWYNPAAANHVGFQMSTGIYRIPYADGTNMTVSNDHHNHNPVDRIDMGAGAANAPVVAAASGVIRFIVDFNGNSNGNGDGRDITGALNPGHDALEHSCQDGTPAVQNSVVVGFCTDYNNYVWVSHPNGEWSKYTHMATGSVTALGWTVGDWIEAGEQIGIEADVGRASNTHLHFELGLVNAANAGNPTPFCILGGHMLGGTCGVNFGINLVPRVCDIANNIYVENQLYTANPCNHLPPTAAAGGPYAVDEGSSVQLDGTGSTDPENNPLTYLWQPADNLDNVGLAQPSFSGIDDSINFVTLTVYDQIEALWSSDVTIVTVTNVAPTVMAIGDAIAEGGMATVRATYTDPGTQDTHTATVDWGDGTGAQPVLLGQLTGAGVSHVYGDNGNYVVLVTVTDDDGGTGGVLVNVTVSNVAPTITLDVTGAIAFPGGQYFVLQAGGMLPLSADGSDPGSDDLTFTWSTGDVNTHFNNGASPDLLPSPFGTFPFAASDVVNAFFADAQFVPLEITLTDDDGGAGNVSGGAIVTGTADSTEGAGWWQHQYSGEGASHIDAATALGYLSIVNAVSSVFSESVTAATPEDVHAILSPVGADRRVHARAALMVAWLEFASGAVAWDAAVPIGGGATMQFLELMFQSEAVILNAAATDAELLAVEQLLDKVRHAQ
jgi:murein DD-endopeptidase MepM/ murein hydrolase activator NlpD